ncbi:hypothetical protein C0992_010668 [Termitomyces sp. T32_za158]|nr:hypothetical protein C0992_010668 [Termitomyces sp. T32_za158]
MNGNWRLDAVANSYYYEFSALPSEVLAEILKHAHWHDLLVMRQVCKRLDGISRVREVWLSQYRQYVAEKQFRPTMEEPLESYSCDELENWVLKRRGADHEWKLSGRSVRERTISVETPSPLLVVPGGRWLLRILYDGSVVCYDLDQQEIRSSILIPPRDNFSDVTLYRLAIDIDNAAPKLTFNLVSYPSSYTGDYLYDSQNMDIMIWSVNLCGHGSTAHLEAHLLHSFVANEPGECIRSKTIQLLPGNRLIVFEWRVVLVYNVAEMLDDQPSTPDLFSHPTTPQWRHSGDYYLQVHSLGLTWNDEAVSLILTSKEQVYRLTVPCNAEKNPYLTGPIDANQSSMRSSTCFEKALFKEGDGYLVKLGFSWGSTMTNPTKQSLVVSPLLQASLTENRFRTYLVEETGRIVIYIYRTIYILDVPISCTKT